MKMFSGSQYDCSIYALSVAARFARKSYLVLIPLVTITNRGFAINSHETPTADKTRILAACGTGHNWPAGSGIRC